MKDTKHSPGPWKAVKANLSIPTLNEAGDVIGAHDLPVTLITPTGRTDDGTGVCWIIPGAEANTPIIQGAPELLADNDRLRAVNAELVASLKQVRAALDQPVQHTGNQTPMTCDILRGDCSAARRFIDAAIANAERGQE